MEFTSTECLHKMNISGCVLSPFTRWILFDTLVNLLKVIKNTNKTQDLSSVQFSRSVVSDSLRPHGLQHARLPCPPLPSRVCSNSSLESVMPSNHLILCHPLLLLPSVLPSIGVFSNESTLHIRWPKYWSSASTSILPMNIEGWFPLGLTGLIFLQSKRLSRVFSSTTIQKH